MTNWDVSRAGTLKELLGSERFVLKKQLGQNFLIDPRILEIIVDAADVRDVDGAFEVGPGAGVVTQRLAARAKRVLAVEKDESLRPVLQQSLSGMSHVEIVYADVLDLNLRDLWTRFQDCDGVSVVANLPYYVTTPILFQVLESKIPFRNMVVMVQREVAERMVAKPGGKDYGALSVAVQYHTRPEIVTRVSPGAFLPPPNVESSVVRMSARTEPGAKVRDEGAFFKVVRAAFATRRKTLWNALAQGLNMDKGAVADVLVAAGIDGQRRGETLNLQEFARIADAWVAHPASGRRPAQG